jgi:hypothetical protein
LDFSNQQICISTNRCKKRSCKRCSEAKGKRIGYHLSERTNDGGHYYHITLTLPPNDDSPRVQAKRLFESFAILRRRAIWSQNILGGIRSLGATRNKSTKQWHSHLHVFVRAIGENIPCEEIGNTWGRLTGATEYMFRPVDSDTYRKNVCYYDSRPSQSELFDNKQDLQTFINETRRMRLIATFGSFRGEPLLPRYEPNAAEQTITMIDSNESSTTEPFDIVCKKPSTGLEYIGSQSYRFDDSQEYSNNIDDNIEDYDEVFEAFIRDCFCSTTETINGPAP